MCSAVNEPTTFRHQTALTLGKSDRRAAYDVTRFASKCGKGFWPPVTEVDLRWLAVKMAEAPSAVLRNMSDVVKKAKLGV